MKLDKFLGFLAILIGSALGNFLLKPTFNLQQKLPVLLTFIIFAGLFAYCNSLLERLEEERWREGFLVASIYIFRKRPLFCRCIGAIPLDSVYKRCVCLKCRHNDHRRSRQTFWNRVPSKMITAPRTTTSTRNCAIRSPQESNPIRGMSGIFAMAIGVLKGRSNPGFRYRSQMADRFTGAKVTKFLHGSW